MRGRNRKRPYKPRLKQEIDLPGLVERFGTEGNCHTYLADLRWPDGVRCPRCESAKISHIKARRQYDCDACRYQFSVRVGTIFHDSKLPLWKWFLAVYVMGESKKGVSANQIKRMLNISYKTAWYLCHRIRAAMKDESPIQLRGVVEADETFIGGRIKIGGVKKGEHRRAQFDNKTCVIGAVERGPDGKVRLAVIPHRGKRPVHSFMNRHVADEARKVHTDEWVSYKGIADEDTAHKAVNHSAKEYVVGKVHTSTIESVWSLFKRSVGSSYHKLTVKHMPAYLDEMAFRYNNRSNEYLFRDTIMKLVEGDPLKYRVLTMGLG